MYMYARNVGEHVSMQYIGVHVFFMEFVGIHAICKCVYMCVICRYDSPVREASMFGKNMVRMLVYNKLICIRVRNI